MPPLTPTVRAALADALALLLPVDCAGCGEPDIALCAGCGRMLRPAVARATLPSGVPVWSGIAFEGVPARVIRAVKEEGRTGLARDLAPCLTAAVGAAVGQAGRIDAIVPIPTSRAAYRRRGFRVSEVIARRARLRTRRLLGIVRRTADQRGLGVDERRANVAGSLRARPVGGIRLLVLDDVLTTGATLDEAVRALRAEGADVLGAVTVAATPRRLPVHRNYTVTTGDTPPSEH